MAVLLSGEIESVGAVQNTSNDGGSINRILAVTLSSAGTYLE